MSASISPDRITGAVLLVNEVLGTHSKQNAIRLHKGDWETYVREGEHLDQSVFLADAEKSELLLHTLDRALDAFRSPRKAHAIRLRFGLDDGQFRILDKVGEDLDPQKKVTKGVPRTLIASGVRVLRHPTYRYHLEAFYGETTTSEIRAKLQALPEPGQRRAKAP